MRKVGLKILKNELSAYVRLAASGETVLVTDRDRVVAELAPPRSGAGPPEDEFVARGVREGWLTPPTHTTPPTMRKPVMSFDELMRDIEADRQER